MILSVWWFNNEPIYDYSCLRFYFNFNINFSLTYSFIYRVLNPGQPALKAIILFHTLFETIKSILNLSMLELCSKLKWE